MEKEILLKEIENTNFYSDTDPQIDKSAKNVLVFHFSMQVYWNLVNSLDLIIIFKKNSIN